MTPRYELIGNKIEKRRVTTRIIKTPPPTGVPALMSCNLSKSGIFPSLGASFFLVNLILYRKSIKGTTKVEVIKNEKRISPRASGKKLFVPILYENYNSLSITLSKPIDLEPLINT